MTKIQKIDKLCRAIVEEMVNRGYADIWDFNYNPTHQVQIDLTIEELRCAAHWVNYKFKNDDESN